MNKLLNTLNNILSNLRIILIQNIIIYKNKLLIIYFFIFFKKKKIKIKSLFAFKLDYKNQEGASGWLNFILTNINKYSIYKFKNLEDINILKYSDYIIEKLIIFFPQSLGFEVSAKLINCSKKIIFFVNDNITFCKKSYNVAFKKECFNCLPNFNPYMECKHFPYPNSDANYVKFLNSLKKKSKSILFICASSNHIKITNSIFPNSKVLRINHNSSHFENIKVKKNNNYKNDFLFHANTLEAKGYFYFLELAKNNPNKIFFVPNSDSIGDTYYKNIIFEKKTWNNGLQEKIYETKIILCPSFWSANFEGSVLKTMLMGKCCAVIRNKMSFSDEVPNNSIIKLTGNIKYDSKYLEEKLNNKQVLEKIGKNARSWALNYLKNNYKKKIKLIDAFLKD